MNKSMWAAVLTCIIVVILFNLHGVINRNKTKECLTVGLVCMGDESISFSKNFLNMENEIKMVYGNNVAIFKRCNVSQESADEVFQDLINENCELIISDSSIFCETAKKMAQNNPTVQFCQAASNNANEAPVLKNYHNFMGRIYEGRYAAGVVAGQKIKELINKGKITAQQAKIGYVAAYPYPEVISGYTAFLLGVRSIVPETVMQVGYVDSWNNFYKEEKLAWQMIKDGCVIISQHTDTNAPAIACEKASTEYTVFHVGYNDNMIEVAPTTSLISTRIDWTQYTLTAINAVMEGKTIESQVKGKTKGQDSWAGFDEDWIQMLSLNKVIIAPGTEQLLTQTIDDIKQGKLQVFKGEYTGKSVDDSTDVIDLKKGYVENEFSSSPSFHYILDDVIQIVDFEVD